MKDYINKIQQAFLTKNDLTSQYLLIILSFVIITILFLLTVHLKMDVTTQESLHLYFAKYVAAAISSLKYDLNGFVGFNNIYNILLQHGNIDDSVLRQAINVKNYSSGGIYKIVIMDLGYTLFVKWAFILFGYHVKSFLYLYFLLLVSSVTAFILEFKESKAAMTLLVLFLMSFLMVSLRSADMQYNVGVIYGFRFMSLLAILPLIHIAFFIFSGKNLDSVKGSGLLIIQSALIIFLYFIWPSVQWMIIVIMALSAFNFLMNSNPFNVKKIILSSIPVVLFLAILVTAKFAMFYSKNEIYKNSKEDAHVFWHSLYAGMALHPEIRKEYTDERPPEPNSKDSWYERSLYRPNDQDACAAVFKWLYKNGKDEFTVFKFNKSENIDYRVSFTYLKKNPDPINTVYSRKIDMEKDYDWDAHEKVIKEVVLDVLKTHPLQVLQSIFIIKPLKFIGIYVNNYVKFSNLSPLKSFIRSFFHLDKLLILATLIGLTLTLKNTQAQLNSLISVLVFIFVFSLIIPFIVYPEPWNTADQSVLLTTIIFMLALKIFTFILNKRFINHFRTEKNIETGQAHAK